MVGRLRSYLNTRRTRFCTNFDCLKSTRSSATLSCRDNASIVFYFFFFQVRNRVGVYKTCTASREPFPDPKKKISPLVPELGIKKKNRERARARGCTRLGRIGSGPPVRVKAIFACVCQYNMNIIRFINFYFLLFISIYSRASHLFRVQNLPSCM